MKFIEREKPRTVRAWIAMKLVRLAQWIQPESKAVATFHAQLWRDHLVEGGFMARVDPTYFDPTNKQEE